MNDDDVLAMPDDSSNRVRRALKDFSRCRDEQYEPAARAVRLSLPWKEMPAPPLLHFLLVDVLGFQDYGRAEKVAWEVAFDYDSIPCTLSFEKFGLRLQLWLPESLSSDDGAVQIRDRITSGLFRGVSILERDFLRAFAESQVSRGNVLVMNQYGILREQYIYFRERARTSYAGTDLLPRNRGLVSDEHVFVRNFMNREAEGSHNTLAMVNAYFSLLEHTLVLLLPFTPAVHNLQLKNFIGLKWSEKFKRIYPVSNDLAANKINQGLREAAEQWRNTYSHGGFDKVGGGLFIHFKNVGVVSAALSGPSSDPSVSLVPAANVDFGSITTLFDEVDEFLRTHPTSMLPMRYVSGGLNVSFDHKSVAKYAESQSSEEDFERLCEVQSHLEDQYANMDW